MLDKETARRSEAPSDGTSTFQHTRLPCCAEDEAAAWLADIKAMAAKGDTDAIRLLPRVLAHFEVSR